MKILWFSNGILSKETSNGSGSWLFAMCNLISKDVELVNITNGGGATIKHIQNNNIKEYILPNWKLYDGLPAIVNITKISDIVKQEKPDIIHIWGIERYWSLLFSRGYITHDKVLLEMQGVASGVADVYFGGLTPYDSRKLISFKSIVSPRFNLKHLYHRSQKLAVTEQKVLLYFRYIATQSDWVRDILSLICKENTSFYHSLLPLRKEFIEARKWSPIQNENPLIFTSASYYVPYKGMHYLFSAIALLKKRYPKIQLRIAGPDLYKIPFIKCSGYERFLIKMIDKYEIGENVRFCGRLNAVQIVEKILSANVFVNPSLVESYSASAAEALYLGAPTVLSYAGAMVNFSSKKPVALYYSPMDYRSLAARIMTMLNDKEKRNELTVNAIEVLSTLCGPDNVKDRQLDTYNQILKS